MPNLRVNATTFTSKYVFIVNISALVSTIKK